MNIVVVTEGSTKHRNADVLKALEGRGHNVVNLGMKNVEGEPDLTYLDIGFLAGLALNLGVADFVVGGCGTGQGFINAVLQFPGVACGLVMDPVEAYLYSRVNAGNCVSLQLNKGYGGVGADINLCYIFDIIFGEGYGTGHPPARAEIQLGARMRMEQLSLLTHLPMAEIVARMDQEMVGRVLSFPGVMDCFADAPDSPLKDAVLAAQG